MEFNIQKYLMENKLTHQSYMREEDDILKPQIANDEEDADVDDKEDSWNKPDPDDSSDFEQQPVKPEEPVDRGEDVSSMEKMQLNNLKKKLSDYIQQYKQKELDLDTYREKVYHDAEFGNIIKKIKSLEKKFYPAVSMGDEEENQQM